MLGEHEAAQARPERAHDLGGPRAPPALPVRRDPALAPDTHDVRAQHKILHEEALVAFKPRAGRDQPGRHDALLVNSQFGALGSLAPTPARGSLVCPGLGGLLHATWLDVRPLVEPLETGNLVALGCDRPLQLRHLADQLDH